uniref:Uncharacterized protein n=1 Tax=Cacopsylla melanoneura TaxID=428564 RepID=A0A8D9AJ46_9HEMI
MGRLSSTMFKSFQEQSKHAKERSRPIKYLLSLTLSLRLIFSQYISSPLSMTNSHSSITHFFSSLTLISPIKTFPLVGKEGKNGLQKAFVYLVKTSAHSIT